MTHSDRRRADLLEQLNRLYGDKIVFTIETLRCCFGGRQNGYTLMRGGYAVHPRLMRAVEMNTFLSGMILGTTTACNTMRA